MSPDERERLLERLLAGDVSESDADVKASLSSDADLEREWSEMRAIQRELEAGATEREVLAEIEGAEWAEGERVAAEVVERWRKPADAPARRWPLALAAAVLIGLGIWLAVPNEPESHLRHALLPDVPIGGEPSDTDANTDAEPRLLGPELGGVHPEGDVERYSPFTWDQELESSSWSFELIVYDAREGAGLARVAGPIRLTEATWRPDPQDELEWPNEILWTIGLVAADGTVQEPTAVRARRVD